MLCKVKKKIATLLIRTYLSNLYVIKFMIETRTHDLKCYTKFWIERLALNQKIKLINKLHLFYIAI